MAEIHVWAERTINAPADHVYRLLADFKNHHPNILPPQFSDFRVEEGGYGAGTRIRFRMTAGGRTREYHNRVEEPEPGRVMTETDLNSSAVTTFTVTPQGQRSLVRFDTRWQGSRGIGGFFERLFAPRVLRRIYEDELQRLDQYAQSTEPV